MLVSLEKTLLLLLLLLLPSQLALHFWLPWTTFSGFRVDYLSPTIYFTDLVILGILAFSKLANKKKFTHNLPAGRHNPPLTTTNLTFVLLIITNIVFSLHPLLSFVKFLRLGLYTLLFIYLVSHKSLFIKLLTQIFPFTLLWVSFLAIMQFGLQTHAGGLWYWLGERPLPVSAAGIAKINLGSFGLFLRSYATFPHPNALGGFLAVGLVILQFLKSPGLTSKVLNYCVLVFGVCGLVLTFSRSAIFVFMVYVVFRIFSRSKKVLAISLIVIAFMMFVLVANSGYLSSISERLILNQQAVNAILSRPFFGLGLGAFTFISLVNHQPVHNIFLLLASEFGVPLVVLISLLPLAIYKRFLLHNNWRLKFALLLVCLTGLVDHYWWTSVQNLLLLTILLTLLKIESSHDSNS